jgi:DNA-binding CsgD family transcriptional regulator
MAPVRGELVRAAEWRRVREFIADTPARKEPAALAVVGEAGAGKSTLWRAGVKAAADAGCRVLRSEPAASEADSSFAGLSDLLADVLPGIAADIPGPQREALEVALLLRPAGDVPPTAHAVGLAVLAGLRSCLQSGPLLLAVDDAQWLDPGSLETLEFALRRVAAGALSLLVTARTEAPADPLTIGAPPLSHGWRGLLAAVPPAEQVVLAPLDVPQIQRVLPSTVTAAQARQVTRQSRGNPFWAREIAAALDSSDSAVPPLARELTGWLCRSLTRPASEAVAVVAAAGRITVPDALTVLGHLEDATTALDEAVISGLVVEAEGRVTAAHPLLGAAALEVMPPGRRAAVYQQLAAAAPSPERRAHFAALTAGPGPDPGVADALDAAATAAHARAANAAAAQFAAQAVTFTPESEPAALVQRRMRAGELLWLAGDAEGALRHLEVLDTGQMPTADIERMLPLLADLVELVHGPDAAADMVAREVDAAGTDLRRRALMLALASTITYGIPGQRQAAAIEAIACAEAAGPAAAPALHRALLNLQMTKVIRGEGMDAELLERAERLEPTLPPGPLHDTADLHRGLWSRFVEDLDTARAALHRTIARARDSGEDWALCTTLSYLAATEELAGDFTAAASALEEADRVAAWYDWPTSPWHVEPRCALLIAAGKLDEARRLADERLPEEETQTVIARFVREGIRGKVSIWQGDAPGAVRHLEDAAWCADQRYWVNPAVRSRVDSLLAEGYVVTGRPEEARRISARLRKMGRRRDRPALIGDACRIDALAAAVTGDLPTAVEYARAAVTAHESSPLRVELARSLLTLGRIERRRKSRGLSRVALQRARDLAAEMGHRPLLAEIARELPRASSARSGAALTEAERRVADQIATGATSREAAAALFVSVRTVETHIASIYRKLGVRTRSELRRALSNRSGARHARVPSA